MNHPLITLLMLCIYTELSSKEHDEFSSNIRVLTRGISNWLLESNIPQARRVHSGMREHPCKEIVKRIIDSVELALLDSAVKTQRFFDEFDENVNALITQLPLTYEHTMVFNAGIPNIVRDELALVRRHLLYRY